MARQGDALVGLIEAELAQSPLLGARILDAACGIGTQTLPPVARGFRLVARASAHRRRPPHCLPAVSGSAPTGRGLPVLGPRLRQSSAWGACDPLLWCTRASWGEISVAAGMVMG